MYNPSLREEPRHKVADVIPVQQETSILDWLETEGRLIPRETQESEFESEEEEIADLMSNEESNYDDMEDNDEDFEED